MAKFYGGNSTVFPGLPKASPATVPIIRQSAIVPPEAMPSGAVVRASPAGFPPFMIRPEVLGTLPQKQIVPPLWTDGTEASLLGNGIFAQRVDLAPSVPPGARPMMSPAAPTSIFTTSASNAAALAQQTGMQASISAKRTALLQNRADKAAYDAQKAANAAAMDPTPAKAGAATAAAQLAADTQGHADWSWNLATQHGDAAAQAALAAQAAADRENAAYDARAAANANAVAQGDQAAVDSGDGYIWPDGSVGPPAAGVDGSVGIPGMASSGYLVPVGGAAVAGLIAAGPVGALLGALLGGGYVFMKQQQANAALPHGPVATAFGPPLPHPPLPYVGESFVPYQAADGTWIYSTDDQNAHPGASVVIR